MKYSYQSRRKVKVSAAVHSWTLAALDRLRRERKLRSRSAALAEALGDWAKEYQREMRVSEAVARYGKRYEKAAESEAAQADRFLPISLKNRRKG